VEEFMKKIFLFSCVAFALIFASCKSTEQATDGEIDVPPVVEEIVEENESSAAEKEPEDNSSLISQIDDARQRALEEGAQDAYPEAFAALDASYEALKNLDDGLDHSAELNDIKSRYEALQKAAAAKKLKERIDDEGLAENSPADYDKGEAALSEFDSLLNSVLSNIAAISESLVPCDSAVDNVKNAAGAPSKKLLSKANEAYDSYYKVYFKSYKKFADDERKNAISQKKKADAVKAQISRKQEYREYAELIQRGDSQYSTSNPESAYESYKEAAASYEALASDVAEKRAAAQKAIDEAKAKVKESGDYALNADSTNPLDEKVEGIEDEDAVLLEDDEFANPDDEIIQFGEIDSDFDSEIEEESEVNENDSVNAGDNAR